MLGGVTEDVEIAHALTDEVRHRARLPADDPVLIREEHIAEIPLRIMARARAVSRLNRRGSASQAATIMVRV